MDHDEIHRRLGEAKTIGEKLDAIEIAAEYGFGGCALPFLAALVDCTSTTTLSPGDEQRLTALTRRFHEAISTNLSELPQVEEQVEHVEEQALTDARVLAEAAAIEADEARWERARQTAMHAAQIARESAQYHREQAEAQAARLEAEAARLAALVTQ